MPKVRLNFDISGHVMQIVEVPQSVLDEYLRQVESGDPNCEALDQMLESYIKYDQILEQLDDAEDIELTELKQEAAQGAE